MALTQVDANQLNTNVFGVVGPYRNRFINGGMQIAQRATSNTVTAGTTVPTVSTGYPTVDRWYVYSTGANVTAAQVAGSGAVKNRLQITGAASVTAVGVGQRIEQLNSYDLAGSNVTLGVDLANSLLTTVTWTAYYATTADTFGTVGTPTKTQIATGTFTVTSTVTRYTANIAIPAAATTGIEVVFTVGAQISGTWTIGNVQLELGLVNSTFEQRSYGTELALCQRYYWRSSATANNYTGFAAGQASSSTAGVVVTNNPAIMRTTPTLSISNTQILAGGGSGAATITANRSSVTHWSADISGSGWAAGGAILRADNNTSAYIDASSEL